MIKKILSAASLAIAATALCGLSGNAQAQINIGYVSYDEGTTAPNIATFDIANLTGPNAVALGDPTDFPVTGTSVGLTDLDLVVTFGDGSTASFGSSAFALTSDGLSFDGPGVVFGTANDAVSAVLTGSFSTTSLSLAGGTTSTIEDTFSATITDAGGGALEEGDLALITATTATTVVPGTPEPSTLLLVGTGLFAGFFVRRRKSGTARTVPLAGTLPLVSLALTSSLLALGGVVLLGSSSAQAATVVSLSTLSTPSSGAAGLSKLNLTSSGLPGGAAAATLQVNLAPTCGVGASSVAGEVSIAANSITTIIGSAKRINFTLPANTLPLGSTKGTVYAWVTGPGYASDNCSIILVSQTTTTLNACVPSSSLAVAYGTNVVSYVPNGFWEGGGTNVQAVTLEGTGAPATIVTPGIVNACSANPATGETVCTANNTDVYLINGTTLTKTLTSSSNNYAGFSGGYCQNCGVAINALTNMAYISGGFSGGGSGDGIQPLNLTTNTFLAPFPTTYEVSENISIDPSRNLILSPGEDGYYDLLPLNSVTGAITAENANYTNPYAGGGYVGNELDSAAEDCTTGIGVASDEFTSYMYITDLTQAVTTGGSPAGSWTAPGQFTYVGSDSGGGFSAGTDGISVAPGTGHLGIITGEFGGNTASVFQLPATSGSGTPALVDYAYFTLPPTPDGLPFTAGFDPHTITAYTSPNNGKAYGVLASWADYGEAVYTNYLAVVDLAALLAADRAGTAHTVNPALDLVAAGIVRYVATH